MHKTPSYDTKLLLKVVFDKTAFVKLKISNNFNQNIDETHSKQPKIHRKIHTSLWILKVSRKKSSNQTSWDFCQKFVISITDFKFNWKSIPQHMDFYSLWFTSLLSVLLLPRGLTYRHPAAHSQGAGRELHQVSLEIEYMPKRAAHQLWKISVKNLSRKSLCNCSETENSDKHLDWRGIIVCWRSWSWCRWENRSAPAFLILLHSACSSNQLSVSCHSTWPRGSQLTVSWLPRGKFWATSALAAL